MGQRALVGPDREIEISLPVSDLPEEHRRELELWLEFDGPLKEFPRLALAAQHVRRGAGAELDQRIAGAERQRLAERRGRLVAVLVLERLPARLRQQRRPRLRRRRQHRRERHGSTHHCALCHHHANRSPVDSDA